VIAATRVFQLDSRGPADAIVNDSVSAELTASNEAAALETSVKQERQWASFPLTRLRPEQIVGSLLQAASLQTIDYQSHIVVRFFRQVSENDFVKRYGDLGADEFDERGGTVPQRLIMMNGDLVKERTKENFVANAATRIAVLAPTDQRAVETAMLAAFTRRPTSEEAKYFENRLAGTVRQDRNDRLEDIYWSLLNSTEFAWNH
jgi:hypothetical protein